MIPATTKSSSHNVLLETLSAQFDVIRQARPLALGIHKTIIERLPEIDTTQLRLAMKIHTASTRYLKALLTTRERFDLDGKPNGEVSDEQREIANIALRERFRKAADRRNAEQLASKEAQRQHEARQKHQEKLAQLAARFNSR